MKMVNFRHSYEGVQPELLHSGAQVANQPEAESLHQLLKNRAEKNPQAIAIMAPGRSPLTYGGLWRQATLTVEALNASGVNRNDRVAIVMPNGPAMAVAFVAVAAGATAAPLNPSARAEEFDFLISDLQARALMIAADLESPAREVARRRNVRIIEAGPSASAEAGMFEIRGARSASAKPALFAEAGDIALVLHTSGTTSRPKIVPLTHANVCRSGHNIAATLALTERDRCLNVMPLFHIHGLIAALVASLAAGGSVVCSPGFDAGKFFAWLDDLQPTWYTAVPTIHQAVLARAPAHREIIARRPMRFIRSSSAALPRQVREEMESVFETQVIEAYGMTEASHQITSNPLAPLPRKAGSVGVAAGPDVAIMDEAGNLLRTGESGEVVIAGANVTPGYENNPTANRSAFTNGWFRTGDQGRFDTEGYLFLTGRLKEIINRGGEKVAPREVDEVLTQHPAVGQAVTFAVPHATLGEEVAAAVVLKPGAFATDSEIRDFARARLSEFKVPKQVLILDELPKGPTGKLQRIGLAEKLADKLASERQVNFVAASTPAEQQLTEIWKQVLKADGVGVCDDFHALGGDSLALTTMMIEVEGRFKREIRMDTFLRRPTIQTLARMLQPSEGPVSEADAAERTSSKGIRDPVLSGLKNRLLQFIALYIPGSTTTRVWLHRMRGVSVGKNVSIGLSALIETAFPKLVSIGDNVSIGIRAVIIGHFRDSTTEAEAGSQPTVRIEDDVYIGPGVIVLPHVTIGRGAVVSAGSVVTRSVPPQTLVQGNPAKPVARCGVSLARGVSYEQFLRHLTPIKEESNKG
jgi:acyl-CoA synthetase (AMP-forming)/AMP-acid ligase II/acetyltransferase-like isoleucine patch superfamily enzyme/acyl carrier protein